MSGLQRFISVILILCATIFMVLKALEGPKPKVPIPVSESPVSVPSTQPLPEASVLVEADPFPNPMSPVLKEESLFPPPEKIELTHKQITTHFIIYHQSPYLSPGFLSDLEGIHAKLLLDLVLFAPWAKNEKITIYLFSNADDYVRLTQRPAWSSGTAFVRDRLVLVYDNPRLNITLAHELSHVLLGDFFAKAQTDPPKWIFEGVAELMEKEQEKDTSSQDRIRAYFKAGNGVPIASLLAFDPEGGGHTTNEIQLWYSQSYSVVYYLLRIKGAYLFHKFCSNLRDQMPLNDALKSTYGWSLADPASLERSWRESL